LNSDRKRKHNSFRDLALSSLVNVENFQDDDEIPTII